jgi:hypothetical protein
MALGRHVLEALKAAGMAFGVVKRSTGSKARARARQARIDKLERKHTRNVDAFCPADWRNPVGVGNRRLRKIAMRHR